MSIGPDDPIGKNARKHLGEMGDYRQCTSKNATGERCRRTAIVGGFVCWNHGGRTPMIRQAARERLQMLVDPAVNALQTVMQQGKCDACGRSDDPLVVVKAAQLVLDRTGHGPHSTVTVNSTAAELSELTNIQLAERLEQRARELRAQEPQAEVTH